MSSSRTQPLETKAVICSIRGSNHAVLTGVFVKPKVFIGSSAESVAIADAVHANLTYHAECTVWKHAFQLAAHTMGELMRNLRETDFGIFILSPDDTAIIRGKSNQVARDNVIFELGMFVGRLGTERTFFLVPDDTTDLHLPSDLAGVTPGRYESGRRDNNWPAALNPACLQIRFAMERLKSFQDAVVTSEVTSAAPTSVAATPPAPSTAAHIETTGKITLEAYGKSFLIKGDTKPHKDRIKQWASWNKKLTAWVLPGTKLADFKAEFADILEREAP